MEVVLYFFLFFDFKLNRYSLVMRFISCTYPILGCSPTKDHVKINLEKWFLGFPYV